MEWHQGEWAYPKKEKAPPEPQAITMLALFKRKRPAPIQSGAAIPAEGLMLPESAASLLATPRRQKLLEHIWQRTSLSRRQFASLYRMPLERYASLAQQFPASESHHHAYPGGMLDHGLEIVAYALKLRQSHLLPVGTTPEDQAAQAEAWTAAVAYAALLHDLGKLAVDLYVEYGDGTIWHPWHGPVQRPYRFRYRDNREYRLHSAATGLLYHQVLDGPILDWLSAYPALWGSLLYVLAGQYEYAGVLGELVIQADRASVAQELGGNPSRAMAVPKHALQRKLLEGLRYLLREELKLNQAQASDGWLTQDALWLVSKTVSDKLRAHLLSQGIDGIPTSNTAVFNVLQDHGMLQPTPEDKAIWRATVTSGEWSHSFTLLKLSPALIWESGERPAPFAGTVIVDAPPAMEEANTPSPAAPQARNTEDSPSTSRSDSALGPPAVQVSAGVPDVMEELMSMIEVAEPAGLEPGMEFAPAAQPAQPLPVEATTQAVMTLRPDAALELATDSPPPSVELPSGEHFVTWLKQGVATRRLIINDAKALVHTVDGTAYLVSPGVFQRYAQEHPYIAGLAKQENIGDWQWVQKRFEKLQLHRKQANGLNIWTCEITGPRKTRRLHGYLVIEPHCLFDDVPPNNPYLHLV